MPMHRGSSKVLTLWCCSLTFELKNGTTSRIYQGHSLYQVWTLCNHSFLSYTANRQTNKQTNSRILPTPADVGMGNKNFLIWLKLCLFVAVLRMSESTFGKFTHAAVTVKFSRTLAFCLMPITVTQKRHLVVSLTMWFVCEFHVNWLRVSPIRPMNWRRGYQKATSPFYKLQIWACFGMTRVYTKFEQGLM